VDVEIVEELSHGAPSLRASFASVYVAAHGADTGPGGLESGIGEGHDGKL